MPAIRFRAAKPPDMDADDSPVLEARALVPQRLAIELDAHLQGMQSTGLLPPGAHHCIGRLVMRAATAATSIRRPDLVVPLPGSIEWCSTAATS
jgi:hypothetical protein